MVDSVDIDHAGPGVDTGTSVAAPGDIPLARICGQRDEALRMMERSIALRREADELAQQAQAAARGAASGASFHGRSRSRESHYEELFAPIRNPERSAAVYREAVDAAIWVHILDAMGMRRLMDATALEDFHKQLANEVPEITEDNIRATIEGLMGDARTIFLRGLARAFTDLDRRFRSHDAFQLGNAKGGGRMIFQWVFNDGGTVSYGCSTMQKIRDVERVFAVLDGKDPDGAGLEAKIREGRSWSRGPCQTVVESRYFRIKGYKNGNAHLWFTRPDLVQRANECLAEYYGEVLPDGVPRDTPPEVCTALARDLAFYPTPKPVAEKLTRDLWVTRPETVRILEPSCGTGNILAAALQAAKGLRKDHQRRMECNPRLEPFGPLLIDGIEVHEGRVARARARFGRSVRLGVVNIAQGNFLAMIPRPIYDYVLMNPPFVGTHWMEHVRHAWEWLAPGGILKAVVPVSYDLGSTVKHRQFREWAKARQQHHRSLYADLPLASFAESGTRVSTGILTLHKPQERT